MYRAELLNVSWSLWNDCCPHNELQCESCSNYDSFRWLMEENWTWIFHNLHLLFKWEIILESHANFCHCPEFPITVIGKVSEGVWRRSRSSQPEMISANVNYTVNLDFIPAVVNWIDIYEYRPHYFVKTIKVNILKLTNAYYIFSSTLIIYINNSVLDEFVVFVGTFSMHLVFR